MTKFAKQRALIDKRGQNVRSSGSDITSSNNITGEATSIVHHIAIVTERLFLLGCMAVQ
jgi:hypothetical protein